MQFGISRRHPRATGAIGATMKRQHLTGTVRIGKVDTIARPFPNDPHDQTA
jgi:hypothetical protein